MPKSFQAIFIKPCKFMEYSRGKNLFNFGVDPTQNGRQAPLWVYYYTFYPN